MLMDRRTFVRTLHDELNAGALPKAALARAAVPPLPKQPDRDSFCDAIDAAMRAGRRPRAAIMDALVRSQRRESRRVGL